MGSQKSGVVGNFFMMALSDGAVALFDQFCDAGLLH